MVDQKGVNELAIELDIAPSTVSIKRRKGKTDEEIRQEAEEFKARQSENKDASLAEAERRGKLALAQLHELKLAKAQGSLCATEDVNQYISSMFLRARDVLLRMPGELMDKLASTSDPITIKNLLTKEIHRALNTLAEYEPHPTDED